MELRQLRYLREIVRQGSFRRAAEALNLTQPALSKSIRSLEDELGVRLVERGAHGVSPTPYGKVLADCALSVVSDIERALQEIRSLSGRGGGVVRVGGMTTLMRVVLPPTVEHFRALDPTAQVHTSIGLVDELLAQLIKGEIDLAILTIDPKSVDDAVVGEKLLSDEVLVVADRDNPLVKASRLTTEALADSQWVLPGQSDHWRRRLIHIFTSCGMQEPNVSVEITSSSLMARIVEGSSLLSLLPSMILHLDPAYQTLRPLDTVFNWPPFDVFVMRRKSGTMLPTTQNFLLSLRHVGKELTKAMPR
jgi:DNA-binding transcriptional LysR family regulator